MQHFAYEEKCAKPSSSSHPHCSCIIYCSAFNNNKKKNQARRAYCCSPIKTIYILDKN